MQSSMQVTTIPPRSIWFAGLAAALIAAGFTLGVVAARGPLAAAPLAVEAPIAVDAAPGLLDQRHGEWALGAADQGLTDFRHGEQAAGSASSAAQPADEFRLRRVGESVSGTSEGADGSRIVRPDGVAYR